MNARDLDLGKGRTRGRNKKSNQFWLCDRFDRYPIKSAAKWLRLPPSRNQTRSHLASRVLPPIQTLLGGRSHFCLILIKRAAKWLHAATKKSPVRILLLLSLGSQLHHFSLDESQTNGVTTLLRQGPDLECHI